MEQVGSLAKQSSFDKQSMGIKNFVPRFIGELFDSGNSSDDDLELFSKNIESLSQKPEFNKLVSKLSESKLVAGMIKENFKTVEKSFNEYKYQKTRRYGFKEEFWDSNFKGKFMRFRYGNWLYRKGFMNQGRFPDG